MYLRPHGPDDQRLYSGSSSDDNLRRWAGGIRDWQSQWRELYAYFNNHGDGNGLRNARTLRSFLR